MRQAILQSFSGALSTPPTRLARGGANDDVVVVRVKLLARVAGTADIDNVGSVAREIAAARINGVCVLSSGYLLV